MKNFDLTGVVHGRFQPFHNDHLKFILAGFEKVEMMYVGITNPDPHLTNTDKADANRAKLLSNPCSYYERLEMVERSLTGAGIARERFRVVPFPINFPELLRHYTPVEAIFFLTIYDAWGERKKELMESVGLKVDVLWKRPLAEKGIDATVVRHKIAGNENWKDLVPPGTAEVILEYAIDERIRKIYAQEKV